TVVLVFAACVALTEVLARTPLAKVLTSRTRVPPRTRLQAKEIEAAAPSSASAPSPEVHEPVGALGAT
ncbi:MAG TPA: hypothetical protein VIY26_00650, partial [Acidimicrobiales bacterium]